MQVFSHNKDYHSLCVANLPVTSHDAYDIQQKIKRSMINKSADFDQKWQIARAFNIDNKTFNREFNEKRGELQDKSAIASQCEIRYGFLSTIKEDMIHKVAEEGLEVRLCPYNYFGHSISGVHISQNADVCMNEASQKIGPNDNIILIVFKYMLGKHKIVPMYDPNVLIAPTPNFDSHLCEDRPDPTERVYNQYIKSLVYLYEFENPNLDPTIRPRHCCPVAALVFAPHRLYDMVDLTDTEPTPSTISVYDKTPISFMKTAPKSNWGREFLLKGSSSMRGGSSLKASSTLLQKDEGNDSKKVLLSEYNETGFHPMQGVVNQGVERWEPIQQLNNPSFQNGRDRSVISQNRSRRGLIGIEADEAVRADRGRVVDRLGQWKGDVVHNDLYSGGALDDAYRDDVIVDQYAGDTLADQYTGNSRIYQYNDVTRNNLHAGGVRTQDSIRSANIAPVFNSDGRNRSVISQSRSRRGLLEKDCEEIMHANRGRAVDRLSQWKGDATDNDQFTGYDRSDQYVRGAIFDRYTGTVRTQDNNFGPLNNLQRHWF